MSLSAPHLDDHDERAPAEGFQAENAERAAALTPVIPPVASEPAAAYQREDGELVWPID